MLRSDAGCAKEVNMAMATQVVESVMSVQKDEFKEAFRVASKDVARLEDAIVGLLKQGDRALADLPEDIRDRLLTKALEAGSVGAVSELLLAGARIESVNVGPGPKRNAYKALLKEAVAIGASVTSTPPEFTANRDKAWQALKSSFNTMKW
jgi:hypothetical protein